MEEQPEPPKNVRILHAVVGHYLGGRVYPVSAFRDVAEVQKLVDLYAAAWTDEPVTIDPVKPEAEV